MSPTWLQPPTKITLACMIAVSAAACDRDALPTPEGELVLATGEFGSVTLKEADAFLLSLPPSRRWEVGTDAAERLGEVARRLAVDKVLLEEARLIGADQHPDLEAGQREVERNLFTNAFLSSQDIEPIDEDALRAAYEGRKAQFERSERREVFHLFKRILPSATPADTVALKNELRELRDQLLAGAGIEQIAREHSESETRTQDGRIGFVEKGQFPPDFDSVVFALERNQPSSIITTKDGLHVFMVRSILEARSFSFDEARQALLGELMEQRQLKRLEKAVQDLAEPLPFQIASPEQLSGALQAPQQQPVLRVGTFTLNGQALRQVMDRQTRMTGRPPTVNDLQQYLKETALREQLFQALDNEGLPTVDQAVLDRARDRQLLDYYTPIRLRALVGSRLDELEQHYQNNRLRFAHPPQAHLERLTVPRGGDPAALTATLEDARRALDLGTLTLSQLAQRVGGQVADWGLRTSAQLSAVDPNAARLAFLLKKGQHSPAYQVGDQLALLGLRATTPARPRNYAQVREQVLRDYVSQHSIRLFKELSRELEEASGFELATDALAKAAAQLQTR